jgi:hypothetical protein
MASLVPFFSVLPFFNFPLFWRVEKSALASLIIGARLNFGTTL